MQTAVPTELCYSMTDPRMPMFAKPLGVAGDEMVADKVQVVQSIPVKRLQGLLLLEEFQPVSKQISGQHQHVYYYTLSLPS